jgi:hypothetical protein
MPTDVRSSDEKFEQPGGSGSEKRRMGKDRRAWGSYRRGLEGQLMREITAGSNSGDRYQREEGKVIAGKKVSVLTHGPMLSARREKEKGIDSGRGVAGPWAKIWPGQNVSPGPFFYFLLFSPFSLF